MERIIKGWGEKKYVEKKNNEGKGEGVIMDPFTAICGSVCLVSIIIGIVVIIVIILILKYIFSGKTKETIIVHQPSPQQYPYGSPPYPPVTKPITPLYVCPNCGNGVYPDQKKCPYCGSKLK